ncbi:MAG: LysR substrate-binding domain-containing protein [Pseudomonadales bacterium]
MNVTVKQLQAFITVAKYQSFAEACIVLHLSQPALSISIKNLEETVGGKLLARSTRSVALTPEGEQFYPVALRLLSDWDKSLEDLHNLFALRRGKLEIAAMPTFASSLLPTILASFHQQYPDINVRVHDVIAEDVVDMVRNGRAEFGISFDPGETQDLEFQPLFRDKFVAVLTKGHPLENKKKLYWQDLQDYSYIALQRPSSIRLLLERELAAHKIVITPVFEVNQIASIGRMVAEGLGVSAVTALSATQMEEMGLQCRPISKPTITRDVGILTRLRHPLSAAAQEMLNVIRNWNSAKESNA